jgi:hypothetical protein
MNCVYYYYYHSVVWLIGNDTFYHVDEPICLKLSWSTEISSFLIIGSRLNVTHCREYLHDLGTAFDHKVSNRVEISIHWHCSL